MTHQEFIYVVINAALYIGLAIFYQKKVKVFTIGSFLLFIWAASAGFAVLYEPNNYIGHFHKIQLSPFFYMFVLNLIAFYPVLKFRSDKVIYFKANPKLLIYSGLIIGVLSVLPFLENATYAFSHISGSGYSELLENMNERYGETFYEPLNYLSKPSFYCSRLFGWIGINLLTYILVVFPLFIDVKKHKIAFGGIVIGNLNMMIMNLNIFARFGIVVHIVMLLASYIILFRFYPPLLRKKANKYIIFALCGVLIVFFAITIYRLQGFNEVSGLNKNKGVTIYLGQYLCEGMPNFSADRSRANVFDKVEEMELGIRSSLLREKNIPKFKTDQAGYRGELIGPQFSTWIGNFYLSLGPWLIFVAFIAGSVFAYMFLPKKGAMTFAGCFIIIAYLRMMILGICYNTYAVGADELSGQVLFIPILFLLERLKGQKLAIAINYNFLRTR